MSFYSHAHLKSLDSDRLNKLLSNHIQLGTHPETEDAFLVSQKDRYSGTYVVGVQGTGKSRHLENLIAQDIMMGESVIALDPHGDLSTNSISQIPDQMLHKVYLLDMEDIDYPFGVNLFAGLQKNTGIAETQAIDRIMHCFEVLWPDVLSQLYLPRYLRAASIALFGNPGATLVDMHSFLTNDTKRRTMLLAARDKTVVEFWRSFDQLPQNEKRQQLAPLISRLESLFMGRLIVRNIVGQRNAGIDFRTAIQNKDSIFIRLPLKTIPQDARLIGTLLIAQIMQPSSRLPIYLKRTSWL